MGRLAWLVVMVPHLVAGRVDTELPLAQESSSECCCVEFNLHCTELCRAVAAVLPPGRPGARPHRLERDFDRGAVRLLPGLLPGRPPEGDLSVRPLVLGRPGGETDLQTGGLQPPQYLARVPGQRGDPALQGGRHRRGRL